MKPSFVVGGRCGHAQTSALRQAKNRVLSFSTSTRARAERKHSPSSKQSTGSCPIRWKQSLGVADGTFCSHTRECQSRTASVVSARDWTYAAMAATSSSRQVCTEAEGGMPGKHRVIPRLLLWHQYQSGC